MVNLGWKPGEFMELETLKKGIFIAYMEKMGKDEQWKEIMKLKVGVHL